MKFWLSAVLALSLPAAILAAFSTGDGPSGGHASPSGSSGTVVSGSVSGNSVAARIGPPRSASPTGPASAAEMRRRFVEAENAYAEGSYALAVERYRAAQSGELNDEERGWIVFRLADAGWRADSASRNPDPTRMDLHLSALQTMWNEISTAREPGYLRPEVAESLGDFWWVRQNNRNWGQAQPYYLQALEAWGESTDIETARKRYLDIVWRIASSEPDNWRWQASMIPTQVLESTRRIVTTDSDRARVDYLLALNLRNGDERKRVRASHYFEAAIEAGRTHPFHDDALIEYAQYLAAGGRLERTASGGVQWKPDYPKALLYYQRIVDEYSKGETPYYDQASREIRNITEPAVGVAVGSAFLPGSRVEFSSHWRNVSGVDFRLYPLDLTEFDEQRLATKARLNWIESISLSGRRSSQSWRVEAAASESHEPQYQTVRVDPSLEPGAYLVVAEAGGKSARDLILVTRLSVLLKHDGQGLVLWVTDALTGEPVGDAALTVAAVRNDRNQPEAFRYEAQTDRDGLARLDLGPQIREASVALHVFAKSRNQQAFVMSHAYSSRRGDERDNWRVYTFADRPAYRPGEVVEWKVTARIARDARYDTPAGAALRYVIRDPRGNEVRKGELKLNEFGGAWAELELDAAWPLGEYNIQFEDPSQSRNLGAATLFRMEEYKLPEFLVRVEVPEEDGKQRAFRVGDIVEADVVAEYTFGGPVAGAAVDVVIYQQAFYPWWRPPGRHPWMPSPEISSSRFAPGWNGNEILRQSLITDAAGHARVTFETPFDTSQDYEYRIEARVTDASRREIVGNSSVRVARQSYFVFLNPSSPLVRPRESTKIQVRTQDANDRGVAAAGEISISRQIWEEVWIGPAGKELEGAALRAGRKIDPTYPSGIPGWHPIRHGYRQEFVERFEVATQADGEANVDFRPTQAGYYQVEWRSADVDGLPITAATTLWVSDLSVELLEAGGTDLRIVADPESFVEGRTAPVLISVPGRDRWVLFSTVLNGLDDVRVLHVTGDAKLVELSIEARHAPNFAIDASMISDTRHLAQRMNVSVAPKSNLLETTVTFDRESYRPGDPGTVTVTARDSEDRPVDAEFALSLVDSSVFYIQQPYAADPRAFFFGQQRSLQVTTASSLDARRLVRLDDIDKDDSPIDGFNSPPSPAAQSASRAKSSLSAVGILGDAMEESAVVQGSRMREFKEADGAGGAAGGDVVVRADFRSTLLWEPAVRTGSDGIATVEFTMADTLSTWQLAARAIDRATRVGQTIAETKSNKPLIVRLQMPRFLVRGDRAVLSAVINNRTDRAVTVSPKLQADGLDDLQRVDGEVERTIPADGEILVEWRVAAPTTGTAQITVSAQSTEHSDAMRRELPVFEHGIDQLLVRSGKLLGTDGLIVLDLPDARRPESTEIIARLSPSLAGTVLDALPYLIDYPYGCTEQTMSRFLPAAIVADTLKRLGIDAESVLGRNFGGIEIATVDKTQPKGPKDLRELDDMVRTGLARLADFQHGDGGWGWWKEGNSDPFMTAYVVWGLSVAQDSGRKVPDDMLLRGAEYLSRELVQAESDPNRQAWYLHAVSAARAAGAGSPNKFEAQAGDNLWQHRDRLNAYGKSLYALAAHARGENERATTLVRNLRNGVQRDDAPDRSAVKRRGGAATAGTALGTAHWGADGGWWRWNDSPVETTAFALKAMLTIDPKNDLIEPTVNWLVRNRRGAQWSNTRDTAIATLALTAYLEHSGELTQPLDVEISVNGAPAIRKRVSAEDILGATLRLELDADSLRSGRNEIRLSNRTTGPLYYALEARFFNMEEPIRPAGSELFVRRQYYRKVPEPTLLGGVRYRTEPLEDQASLASGDRVEVVLTVETKNDFEYLLFEDLKPAGLEAVDRTSGAGTYARELSAAELDHRFSAESHELQRTQAGRPRSEETTSNRQPYVSEPVMPTIAGPVGRGNGGTGRSQWLYRELRDRKIALFADKLPQGVWEIRYELRAEVPGTFHALPLIGEAMYVPEIRGNGTEIRIEVTP